MPRSSPAYSAEFRRETIGLVRAGRTSEKLIRKCEPSAQPIRTWVHQADPDERRRADGLSTGRRKGLRRLRRENVGRKRVARLIK